jgi:DNA repair protein SbcC/Rad50
MKFRHLLLEDFQAHQRLAVEFSPSITTIKGPTDVGKSAILRALRWVCLNDLDGPAEAYIRDGAKSASVRILTGEKDEITREKGRANTYTLNDEEYKAVGSTVPDEIAGTLRLSPLNFQGQYAAPFWFSESAPEVSRQLNAVVDLSIIDTTLSNIVSTVRQAAERRNVCQERISKLTEEQTEMTAQKGRVEEYKALKQLKREADDEANDYDRLEELLRDIDSLDLNELEDQAKEAEALVELAREALAQARRWETLSILLDEIDEVKENIEAFDTEAGVRERKFHQAIKGQRCPLCNQVMSK